MSKIKIDTSITSDDYLLYETLLTGSQQKEDLRKKIQIVMQGHIAIGKSLDDAFAWFNLKDNKLPKYANDGMYKAFRHLWSLIQDGKIDNEYEVIFVEKGI